MHPIAESKVNTRTGLRACEFAAILPIFSNLFRKKYNRYRLDGKPRKRNPADIHGNTSIQSEPKLLTLVLEYMRHNVTQSYLGEQYQISQSKVSTWINFLLPLVVESLKKLGVMPQLGLEFKLKDKDCKYLLGDVTDCPSMRKTCYQAQKVDYSGKHHKHTAKHLAICDPSKSILFLTPAFTGSTHDKAILDELELNIGQVPLFLDAGFQGAEHKYESSITPFKKQKKGDLTEVMKQINQALASIRVGIEHVFKSMKHFKVLAQKLRMRDGNKRNMFAYIAAGLHNLRIALHKKLE